MRWVDVAQVENLPSMFKGVASIPSTHNKQLNYNCRLRLKKKRGQGDVDLFGSSSLGIIPISICQDTKHKSLVGVQSNRNCQASSESAGVSRNHQDQLECLEKFSATPLNDVKFSQDVRPMKRCKASYARALSLSIEYYLYSLQTSRVLPQVVSQQNIT